MKIFTRNFFSNGIMLAWHHMLEPLEISSERPDFRRLGSEKRNLRAKTSLKLSRMSPNHFWFTHIKSLRLPEIVGQSNCSDYCIACMYI